MPASEIVESVNRILQEFRPRFGGAAGDEIEDLIVRLREPVRVAVVGRVKAGKSTLVNALLGQRVAPTDVSECTRIVTWFHYGNPQRVEVHMVDGSTVLRQLDPDGRLPAEIGVPVEQVRSLHVYLANEALKDLTLIDTPGMASVNENYSAATERLLSESTSGDSTERADAVVFLMNQVLMAEEMEALETISSTGSGGAGNAALNTVGVLSKADKLGDGDEDPWPVAVALANRYEGQLRDQVSTVVPVVGLVAETAETAALTEVDARSVASLSRDDAKELERALWSADRFIQAPLTASPEARQRLLALLDLYGVGHAVRIAKNGTGGATDLRRELSALSGISEVKRALLSYFKDKDHVLKARSAFAVAERLSYRTTDALDPKASAELRASLEQLRLEPMMQALDELEVWQECRAGRVDLGPEGMAELERVSSAGTLAARVGVEEGDPSAVIEAAKAAMTRWRTFMVTEADPAQANAARVLIRSYQLIWTAAKSALPATA